MRAALAAIQALRLVPAGALTELRSSRPCLTNRLRLVVSPRGCYLCTPHRGRMDKSIGNARTKELFGRLWG